MYRTFEVKYKKKSKYDNEIERTCIVQAKNFTDAISVYKTGTKQYYKNEILGVREIKGNANE